MSRRIDFTLTGQQLAELEQAINSSPYPEVRQRAIAIRMLHLGQHPEQVGKMVMVTSNTIYGWHKRWREQGMAGLRDGQRTGRPNKADRAYVQELERVLELDPRTLGCRLRSGRSIACGCIWQRKPTFCSAILVFGR